MCYTVVLGSSCDLSSSDLSLGPQSYVHSPCRCSGITHRYHTVLTHFNVIQARHDDLSPVPALGRGLRQEDCCKFKINLDYIAIPCVKNQHAHAHHN